VGGVVVTRIDAFETPEYINHDEPPGVRLEASARRRGSYYDKPLDGVLIAEQVGVEAMRLRCAHFREWLDALVSRLAAVEAGIAANN
jgi:Domain of unknown function (DUF4276)